MCMQFESSFKTLLINNLTSAKTVKGNCKHDEVDVLFSLRNCALLAQECENSEEESTEAGNKTIDEDEHAYALFPDVESNCTGTCIDNSRILMKLVNNMKSNNCCDNRRTDLILAFRTIIFDQLFIKIYRSVRNYRAAR